MLAKDLEIGDKVLCPANQYGIEFMPLMDGDVTEMPPREGVVEFIPKHRRFVCVRVKSLRGNPIYMESFREEELTKMD